MFVFVCVYRATLLNLVVNFHDFTAKSPHGVRETACEGISIQTLFVQFSQKKSTAVKPFVFQLDSRLPVKRDDEKEEETKKKGKGYVPTAEYLFKFETATPERFRTLSRRSLHPTCAGTHSSMPASSSGVTMPYTPKLHTLARARPTITKSAAALEEEEMARIRE